TRRRAHPLPPARGARMGRPVQVGILLARRLLPPAGGISTDTGRPFISGDNPRSRPIGARQTPQHPRFTRISAIFRAAACCFLPRLAAVPTTRPTEFIFRPRHNSTAEAGPQDLALCVAERERVEMYRTTA